MARAVIVKLDTGTPVHLDGLCPKCFCSTLWSIPVYRLTPAGVARIGVWRGCFDCREGITP